MEELLSSDQNRTPANWPVAQSFGVTVTRRLGARTGIDHTPHQAPRRTGSGLRAQS